MRVFISWSGVAGKAAASAVRKYLPHILQQVRPYMSEDDTPSGTRWGSRIAEELKESQVGIICVTPANLTSPWLNFEAGAISRQLDRSLVIPLLLSTQPGDLRQSPLSQFQARRFDQEGFRRIVLDLNDQLPTPRSAQDVQEVFSTFWPRINRDLSKITYAEPEDGKVDLATQLQEALRHSRSNSKTLHELASIGRRLDSRWKGIGSKVEARFQKLRRQVRASRLTGEEKRDMLDLVDRIHGLLA